MSWRKNLDQTTRTNLELQIKESLKHKRAINSSSNPRMSQLWIAIANLSKQNFDLNLRLKYLEKGLKESLKRKSIKVPSPKQEMPRSIVFQESKKKKSK